MTSFNDPVHLHRAGHIDGDGPHPACESCGYGVGDTRINGHYYCCDCVVKCGTCSDPMVNGENGTVDEEGGALCCWCESRHLRMAHPPAPTTVHKYLVAKARRHG